MRLLDIVSKFENPKKIGDNSYQVRCNSHNDKENSLTITEEDNKILMHCHARMFYPTNSFVCRLNGKRFI